MQKNAGRPLSVSCSSSFLPIDLFARHVLGWAFSSKPAQDLFAGDIVAVKEWVSSPVWGALFETSLGDIGDESRN